MTFHKRSGAIVCFPLLFISSQCLAAPECDSIDTRQAVLDVYLGDSNNPLVNYAIKSSTTDVTPLIEAGRLAPLYELTQKLVTTSTSRDKSTVECSGGISVSLGDVKVTKEISFSAQQSSNNRLSVAVKPFEF